VKPETIRIIDVYIGKPLCFVLTLLRKLKSSRQGSGIKPTEIKKILFIKFIEQGATVLAYNALYEAVGQYGRKNVYFTVFDENGEILDILDLLLEENIFYLRSKGPLKFLRDWWKTLRMIRRMGIDATVDLEFFTRAPAVFAYKTRAPVRVGLHRFNSEVPYRGDLMTHKVQYSPYLHVSKLYTLLVRALDADPLEVPLLKVPANFTMKTAPKFAPKNDELEGVMEKLREINGTEIEGPMVLLNPNASDMLPLRKWPAKRFIDLGKKILKNHANVTLVITGAPSEKQAGEEIARAIGKKRVFSMAGKTTLRELIVLCTLAHVLITNDSGPSHFSSLTNIDAIVLFGPETPYLYGIRRKNTHIIWAELACSPCVNVFNHRFSPCTNNLCMQGITVEEVYEKVRDCLKRRSVKAR
jgi:ADP-heptose:LPS heptosyltransferase